MASVILAVLTDPRVVLTLVTLALTLQSVFAPLCALLVILSLLRPRCWRRPRVKWNGVTQSRACSWRFRQQPRTIRSLNSSECPNIESRASGWMSRHEYYHVFARISGTVVAQHATNEIGLEIRLSDHGHALSRTYYF